MQQLYTSAEAARLLSISDGTVRSWLSRFPEAFKPDIHIVMQDGKKLWTEAGIELLRQRAAENAAKEAASHDPLATHPLTESIANNSEIANSTAIPPTANDENLNKTAKPATFNDALVDGFTDKLSLEIAAAIAEKLPGRVLHHINRMLHHNPTMQEREILQHATVQQMQQLPGIEKKYLALPQSK